MRLQEENDTQNGRKTAMRKAKNQIDSSSWTGHKNEKGKMGRNLESLRIDD